MKAAIDTILEKDLIFRHSIYASWLEDSDQSFYNTLFQSSRNNITQSHGTILIGLKIGNTDAVTLLLILKLGIAKNKNYGFVPKIDRRE